MSDLTPEKTTMQTFAQGDVFLGCTYLNNPEDDHAGRGRIIQYDKDLNLKGVLWIEDTTHLVGGCEFDPDGVLWAFDNHTVIRVDPKTGRELPRIEFLPRIYRSASFDKEGNVFLGEHVKGKEKRSDVATSIIFPKVPGTDLIGYGHIYKYDRGGNLLAEYKNESAPELTGFKGVTHSTLHPSEQFITYTTETGKRIMRYDVVNNQQMPDLVTYPGDDLYDRNWVIAVKYLADGRLIITRGDNYQILDEEGNVLEDHVLGGYGWTDIEPSYDGEHILFSNIWTGKAAKVHLNSGEVVGWIDTGYAAPLRCVAGIAEYKG